MITSKRAVLRDEVLGKAFNEISADGVKVSSER